MFGISQTKSPPLDRQQSISAVPAVNPDVTVTEMEGSVLLRIPRRQPTGIMARLYPPFSEKQIKLDELGSSIFRMIDGERTVQEIIKSFIERYRVNQREAELSTVAFLKSLATRNVIAIGITTSRDE